VGLNSPEDSRFGTGANLIVSACVDSESRQHLKHFKIAFQDACSALDHQHRKFADTQHSEDGLMDLLLALKLRLEQANVIAHLRFLKAHEAEHSIRLSFGAPTLV
jgi:hypothetical protein